MYAHVRLSVCTTSIIMEVYVWVYSVWYLYVHVCLYRWVSVVCVCVACYVLCTRLAINSPYTVHGKS